MKLQDKKKLLTEAIESTKNQISNDALNNSELFYKKTLNLNTKEDVTRALYLYTSILERLDKITDKILAFRFDAIF